MNTKTMKVYAVIEMSPWRDSNDPELNLAEGEAYEDFAIKVFKEHGIHGIKTLDPYSYSSFDISVPTDQDWEILIEKELIDAEIEKNGLELVGPFSGGLIIISDGNVIHNECCGSISDYKSWVEFVEEPTKEWGQIWIGHPWVYARVNDGVMEISEPIEHTGPLNQKLNVRIKLDFELFKEELNKVVSELQQLEKRFRKILEANETEYAKELSSLLIHKE